MHLSTQTDDGGDFWGGVPRTHRRRSVMRDTREENHRPTIAVELGDVHESLEQGIALINTSLRQAVTDILVEADPEQVVPELESFFEKTTPAWNFLLQARARVNVRSGSPDLDLVQLARNAPDFYPKESGRVYVRAAIYLNADVVALAEAGEFPALSNDWLFLTRHQMLLTAGLIASENLKVSDASTEVVAKALWFHWGSNVKSAGADFPEKVDRLVEDAYLKAAADESEYEDEGEEPEVWMPEKVIGGGYA